MKLGLTSAFFFLCTRRSFSWSMKIGRTISVEKSSTEKKARQNLLSRSHLKGKREKDNRCYIQHPLKIFKMSAMCRESFCRDR